MNFSKKLFACLVLCLFLNACKNEGSSVPQSGDPDTTFSTVDSKPLEKIVDETEVLPDKIVDETQGLPDKIVEQPVADFTQWKFHRVDGKSVPKTLDEVKTWEDVKLPHTPKVEGLDGTKFWQGTAYYKKVFSAPKRWEGKRIMLRFNAAMNVAKVTFNGQLLTTHLGGYLPFDVDMTPYLLIGEDNELVVELDNRDNAITGPNGLKGLDFSQYGGLYRTVDLLVKPLLQITDTFDPLFEGTEQGRGIFGAAASGSSGGGGIYVSYPEASATSATINVKTHLYNAGANQAKYTVTQELFDGKERVLLKADPGEKPLPGQANTTVEQKLIVTSPKLWSPRSPNLYRLVTTLEGAGQKDIVETTIGIRRIAIDIPADNALASSFSINGEKMFLRGVNRNQEYPYIGYATSPEADYRDAKIIKEAGFDFVRLAHYPQSEAFLNAADQLGLVLLEPLLGWQYANKDPAFDKQVLRTCHDMIRRDRNHAATILWECQLNETGVNLDFRQKLTKIVHEELPGDQAWSAGFEDPGYDLFMRARQHNKYKTTGQVVIVDEYGDWEYFADNAGFDQPGWKDLKPGEENSRQAPGAGEKRLLQQTNNIIESHNDNLSRPHIFADGYWAMFDYTRGYANDLEHSGVMGIKRQQKFAYQFFRSQRDADYHGVGPTVFAGRFDSGPMVFIASYWNKDSSPKIRVFSNAEEVELFLNGKSLGRNKPDRTVYKHLKHPAFQFDATAFTAGKLEAVAYISGKEVARHSVETAGAPKDMVLSIDDEGLPAAKNDVVFVRAQMRDANGNTPFISGQSVTFKATGNLEIIGDAVVPTEAGIASILVRSKGDGSGTLHASDAFTQGTLAVPPRHSIGL